MSSKRTFEDVLLKFTKKLKLEKNKPHLIYYKKPGEKWIKSNFKILILSRRFKNDYF